MDILLHTYYFVFYGIHNFLFFFLLVTFIIYFIIAFKKSFSLFIPQIILVLFLIFKPPSAQGIHLIFILPHYKFP
jgi:hypothetical protein